MDTIDFKALEAELHGELVRVERWRRVVRVLSVVVYLLVFCWFMFVLFGGLLLARLGWDDYGMLTQTLLPVFIGLVVLSFLLSRSMASFQRQEAAATRRVMQAVVGGGQRTAGGKPPVHGVVRRSAVGCGDLRRDRIG